MIRRMANVNERGHVVGQGHWRAKLSDEQVEMMRDLHGQGWGYKRLAKAFNVSREAARAICRFEIRAQTSSGFKLVMIKTQDHGNQTQS